MLKLNYLRCYYAACEQATVLALLIQEPQRRIPGIQAQSYTALVSAPKPTCGLTRKRRACVYVINTQYVIHNQALTGAGILCQLL